MLALTFASLLMATTFARDAWLADFHQILDEMSSHYANLDSAIEDRHMDLPQLRRRTEEQLANAKSDDEAKQVIERFLRAFGDGHVGVEWKSRDTPPAPETDNKPLCDRLGYRSREDLAGIDFSQLPGYHALDDADARDFPGGMLKLDASRTAGIVRIRLFSPEEHPQLCQSALEQLNIAADAACDSDCEVTIERTVGNLMNAALERRVAALRAAGARALVVDITANGGGSDWVEAAARILTPVPLKSPSLGFIRHPHWVKQLREELRDIVHDLQAGVNPTELHQFAKRRLERAIAEADKPCDRTSVWLDERKPPSCSLVVRDMLFASGIFPVAKPSSIPEGWARNTIFHPAQFTYHEGANTLPLYIITDGRTASASELFVNMLHDNRAATLIGTPTNGSGCGHTNGGIYATLSNSGARLSLPDCARFRADGTNEVVGITPDVLIPFRGGDSAYQRALKVQRTLQTIVK